MGLDRGRIRLSFAEERDSPSSKKLSLVRGAMPDNRGLRRIFVGLTILAAVWLIGSSLFLMRYMQHRSEKGRQGSCGMYEMKKDGIIRKWLESVRNQPPLEIDELSFTPWSHSPDGGGTGEFPERNCTLFPRPRIYRSYELDPERKYLRWSRLASNTWGISNKYFFLLEYMHAANILNRTLILPEAVLDRSSGGGFHLCQDEDQRNYCHFFIKRDGIHAIPTELFIDVSAQPERSKVAPKVIFMDVDDFHVLETTRATKRTHPKSWSQSHWALVFLQVFEPRILLDSITNRTGGIFGRVEILDHCFFSFFDMMNWFFPMRYALRSERRVLDFKAYYSQEKGWILELDSVRFALIPNRFHFGSLDSYHQYVHLAQEFTVPSKFVQAAAHRVLALKWPAFSKRGYGPEMCLHWRRGDFATQWKESDGLAGDILAKGIDACRFQCGRDLDVLVITDEVDPNRLDEMRAMNITLLDDVFAETGLMDLPLMAHLNVRALVSQMVCGSALGFAGITQSSFSNRIMSMRGDHFKSTLLNFLVIRFFPQWYVRNFHYKVIEDICCKKVFEPTKKPICSLTDVFC